jgi:hypothetical protein
MLVALYNEHYIKERAKTRGKNTLHIPLFTREIVHIPFFFWGL